MKLSKGNQKVVDVLRTKQLTYLIKPFREMVELSKLGKIKIHKMTWKVIMRDINNEHIARSELENMFIAYFVNFGIFVVKKRIKDKRVSKERVKSHREHKKSLGYTQLSVMVSEENLDRLKRFKKKRKMTYQEAFEFMIRKL